MNPRLIVIAGPSKGTVFAVGEAMSVGREPSNELHIDDPSVSRRHCLVKREGDEFKVSDLDSFNGTFVNDTPVKEHVLTHGDQIAVGDTLLLFLLHNTEPDEEVGRVQIDEGGLVTRSTVRLKREHALYLEPARITALESGERAARDLAALLKIGASLASAREMEPLQRQLLEAATEVIPAERGAILLLREGLDDPDHSYGWQRGQEAAQTVRVSRTVAEQVLREGVAILSNDILQSDQYKNAGSLVSAHSRALICAPLVADGRASGLIYLDTSDPATRFDEGHLQLLVAIAGMASVTVENVRHFEWLKGENLRLSEELSVEHNLIGEGRRMREVYQLIAKVAPTDSTVFIRGESGTGKELAARAIHANSKRKVHPFVAINCATLGEQLLESELFGHERGAFTGAVAQKKGKLEVAEGGTVFLDEVGELEPALQAKLLRVLQEREFERVGGTRPIKVDVRVLAATNKDLEEAIRQGVFRQDLYYRLNVVSLEMPPLRERREDIPLLASYFTARCAKKCKRRVAGIAPEARALLMAHDWPGNVRELENAIERAVVLGAMEFIAPEDLPETLRDAERKGRPAMKYDEAVRESKRRLIIDAMREARGNYTEAANILGVHPNNLHRLIRTLNLRDSIDK